MIPSSPAPPASTFIVRFWWDRSGDESRWRGRIEHLQSGESASCPDLEGILDCVRDLGVMADHLSEPRGGRRLVPSPANRGLMREPWVPGPFLTSGLYCLMGVHGLRVAEVTSLEPTDVSMSQGIAVVTGKSSRTRTVYLTGAAVSVPSERLAVREYVAQRQMGAVSVIIGPDGTGTAMSTRAPLPGGKLP